MRNRVPVFLLVAAVAVAAALLLSLDSHLTFLADGWELLIKRRGWSPGDFLDPFHEHLILAPALIYKALIAVFGMGSALPFYAVSISLFLLSAVLLFAYIRARIGDWPALIAAVLVLFLGAASEDLLWEFQMAFFGSVAAGLGMLIALDRGSRRGDRVACGLLALSLSFSGVGVAFAAAGLADLALGRRPRRRRAYVALLPLALYVLWWLGWGRTAGGNLSLENLEGLPHYMFDSAAAGIASLLGRDPLDASGHPPLVCQALLVLFIGLAGLRIARLRRMPRGLAIALTLALVFWALSGLDRTPERYATASRYQYPSAVFILLVAAELLRGVRLPRIAVLAMGIVTAGAVLGGVSLLHRDYDNTWKPMADQVRLTLAAIDIAGDNARADYPVSFPPSITISRGAYLAATRDHGSPAFSEAELLARSEQERQAADAVLAEASRIGLRRADPLSAIAACRFLSTTGPGHGGVSLRPGLFDLENPGAAGARVRLGRFARGFRVGLGRIPPGDARSLAIPRDSSPRPWMLHVASGSVRVCRQQSRKTSAS